MQSDSKESQWKAVCDHINHWYYKADLDALSIALACYVSHYDLNDKAVWLFVIGPSGTGKTEIICNAIGALSNTFMVSDVSESAFISGLPTKRGGSSLLLELPKLDDQAGHTHGVLILKDFTSIISKKVEARAEIMSQLRHIHDGAFSTKKGTKTIGWTGKVTIIAAVTPAIEKAWAIQRDLGERFVQIRWPREDGVETALYAAKHIGHDDITKKMQTLIKKFVDQPTLMKVNPKQPDPTEFAYLSEMTAILRGNVIRESSGARDIIDIPQYEAPTRLMKAMLQIAISHAKLFRREECSERDISLAKRIAIDSIPLARLKVINSIHKGTTQADIVKNTGMVFTTVNRVLEDLIALEVITGTVIAGPTLYTFTDMFAKLRTKALGVGNIIDFPAKSEVK